MNFNQNRCNKDEYRESDVCFILFAVTFPSKKEIKLSYAGTSIKNGIKLRPLSATESEGGTWEGYFPAVAERRDSGLCGRGSAVVSHSWLWSLDERVRMVTGCSVSPSPVSQGTTSSFVHSQILEIKQSSVTQTHRQRQRHRHTSFYYLQSILCFEQNVLVVFFVLFYGLFV